jgi:ketosteroid isomerase-like protein
VADDLEIIVESFRLLNSDTYEEALELVDDEFEMVTTADLASEPDVYRGPEGARRWWESCVDVMEWVRLEVLNSDPVDDHRAILEFVIHTRGRASGIETDQHAVAIATARDGKLLRLQFFTELGPARAAAGLPPG